MCVCVCVVRCLTVLPCSDRAELDGLRATLTKTKLEFQTKEAKLKATIERQQHSIDVCTCVLGRDCFAAFM